MHDNRLINLLVQVPKPLRQRLKIAAAQQDTTMSRLTERILAAYLNPQTVSGGDSDAEGQP